MVSGRTQINKWEERNNEVRKLKGEETESWRAAKQLRKP